MTSTSSTLDRTEADLLAIRVGGNVLAVGAWCVTEIVEQVAIRPLPEAPADVEGIATVRGTAVPVVDLRRRMGLPADDPGLLLLVRLAETEPPSFAIRVDEVAALWNVTLGAIDPPPAEEALGPPARFLLGVLTHAGETALVFDLPEILAAAERISLRELVSRIEESGS